MVNLSVKKINFLPFIRRSNVHAKVSGLAAQGNTFETGDVGLDEAAEVGLQIGCTTEADEDAFLGPEPNARAASVEPKKTGRAEKLRKRVHRVRQVVEEGVEFVPHQRGHHAK